ncbi:hypothetical protein N7497_010534 [Penicillium chrysogenum]|nr:hypothetical protein N7497_010534 [Penicillium chrysogenum]
MFKHTSCSASGSTGPTGPTRTGPSLPNQQIKPDEPTGPAAGRSEKSASAQPSTNYPAASYRQGARATRSIERPNEPGSSSSLSADRASCLRSLRSEMVDTSSRRQDRFLNSTLPKPVHMQAPKGIDLPRVVPDVQGHRGKLGWADIRV